MLEQRLICRGENIDKNIKVGGLSSAQMVEGSGRVVESDV